MIEGKRILLINDDYEISSFLREKLVTEGGYSVVLESNSHAGFELFLENAFDAVIIKFGMSDFDSKELIKSFRRIDQDCVILVFLDEADEQVSEDLLGLGVYDFITRPINEERMFFLIKKGTELHSLTLANRKLTQGLQEQNVALQKQNTLLARRIEESTKNLTRLYEDLRSTYMRTIKVLAQAIDARDHYTHSHSENVAKYAVAIAEEMECSAKEVELIREACELHDLGKIGVEDSILSKTTDLTPQEWEQIKRHPVTGAQILEPLTFLNGVIDLVRQHHEHYDGLGYPDGRSGEDILLGARIIHLADAYESMRSARSYRTVPLTKEEAVQEIKSKSGTQFDPRVVEAFLRVVNNF